MKAILFRKNNFIYSTEVNRLLVIRYFFFFSAIDKNSNHLTIRTTGILDMASIIMSRNDCERIQFFIRFMKTKEINSKVTSKISNIVFRLMKLKLLEFCVATKSYTSE